MKRVFLIALLLGAVFVSEAFAIPPILQEARSEGMVVYIVAFWLVSFFLFLAGLSTNKNIEMAREGTSMNVPSCLIFCSSFSAMFTSILFIGIITQGGAFWRGDLGIFFSNDVCIIAGLAAISGFINTIISGQVFWRHAKDNFYKAPKSLFILLATSLLLSLFAWLVFLYFY